MMKNSKNVILVLSIVVILFVLIGCVPGSLTRYVEVFKNNAGDCIKVISFDPDPPVTLEYGEKFFVKLEYTLESCDYCQIWAQPYRNGHYGYEIAHQGSTWLEGSDEISRYILSWEDLDANNDSKSEMDQVHIKMIKINQDGTQGQPLIEGNVDAEVIWKVF